MGSFHPVKNPTSISAPCPALFENKATYSLHLN
jgi:hypothetical protein